MRSIVLLVAVALAQPAHAATFDWLKTEAEMGAAMQVASAYALGHRCNRNVNNAVAAKFLNARLGERRYSAEQMADLMFAVIGSIGMQEALLPGPASGAERAAALRRVCATADKAFGRSGTEIPGILE